MSGFVLQRYFECKYMFICDTCMPVVEEGICIAIHTERRGMYLYYGKICMHYRAQRGVKKERGVSIRESNLCCKEIGKRS